MTEAEWLACTNPQPMLEFLRRKVSDRKVRLFAVACCRRIWSSLEPEEFRDAVRKAESFSDGLANRAEMLEAHEKARAIFAQLHGKDSGPGAALTASGFPSVPKSFLQRVADALDDPWWEDEFDKGDRLAPALVTARHAARGTSGSASSKPHILHSGGSQSVIAHLSMRQRNGSRILPTTAPPPSPSRSRSPFRPIRLLFRLPTGPHSSHARQHDPPNTGATVELPNSAVSITRRS